MFACQWVRKCGRNSALIRRAINHTGMVEGTIATESTTSSRLMSRSSAENLQYNDNLFNFTRGRFISNEAHELSQRHVRFNVNELARIAAEAIGAKSCVSIEKYPDGMYNKAILLTMEDGTQVVAKVPNPNAGLPHFTTASEVATMEFVIIIAGRRISAGSIIDTSQVRDVLGTPVPRVYAWSSKPQENDVGAEYIIMEKLPGIELERIWPRLEIGDRFTIVKAIAQYQMAWMSVSFEKFGSLYYAKDVDEKTTDGPLYTDQQGVQVSHPKFAIGPSGILRENITPQLAVEKISCVNRLVRLPRSPITLCGPGTYQPTREKKLKALQYYLALLKYILPTDQSVSSSCLWHGDLHAANIFVNPSKPTEIVGLIDWQSTELAPRYSHARQTYIIDYDGPPVHGLERPSLPQNMGQLDSAAQKEAQILFLQQSLCVLYNTLIHQQNPSLYRALEFQKTPCFSLLLLARNLVVDGEATYLAQVAQLEAIWDTLPMVRNATYPFTFSADERAEIEADVDGAVRGMELMRAIQEALGDLFPEKGIVRPEQYEEALDALGQMREQVIEEYARDEHEREIWRAEWPFGT